MTKDDLLALPVAVPVTTAGKAFGMSRATSYNAAKTGNFPIRVIKAGKKLVVAREDLLRELGITNA